MGRNTICAIRKNSSFLLPFAHRAISKNAPEKAYLMPMTTHCAHGFPHRTNHKRGAKSQRFCVVYQRSWGEFGREWNVYAWWAALYAKPQRTNPYPLAAICE